MAAPIAPIIAAVAIGASLYIAYRAYRQINEAHRIGLQSSGDGRPQHIDLASFRHDERQELDPADSITRLSLDNQEINSNDQNNINRGDVPSEVRRTRKNEKIRRRSPALCPSKYCVKVTNVNRDATETDLRNHFKDCNIRGVRIARDEKNQSKGVCLIDLADEHSVQRALDFNETKLMGRRIFVVEARKNIIRSDGDDDDGDEDATTTIDTPYGTECPICMESVRDGAFVPCGHTLCVGCAERIKARKRQEGEEPICPFCRQPFTGIITLRHM